LLMDGSFRLAVPGFIRVFTYPWGRIAAWRV